MKYALLILIAVATFSGCSPVKKSVTAATSTFSFEKITTLDARYTETSGLEFLNDQLITHNDSGDEPRLYFLDTLGNGISQTQFNNMSAIDWEDITQDDQHVYIADIGNNFGDRKDLVIYRIRSSDATDPNAPVHKMIINYPDQMDFTRNEQQHAYDAESLVAIGDFLYVFSKDWKDLSTVVYRLDKNNQQQSATVVQSHPVNGLITGATYNGTDKVILCGYTSLLEPFIIQVDYDGGKFSFRDQHMLPLIGAQIEAITYTQTDDAGNETYYLSSEAVNIKLGEDEAKSDAQLYRLRFPAGFNTD
jgi:hypothetical protein